MRILEQKLDIKVELKKDNVCRFCHKEFCSKSNTTRHLNTCKKKQEYRKELERNDKENAAYSCRIMPIIKLIVTPIKGNFRGVKW